MSAKLKLMLAKICILWYTFKKGVLFMKKSPVKTVFKSIFLTLGILSFLYSFVNPIVYHFGAKTEAIADSIDYTPSDGGLCDYSVSFHYFVSGVQYDGSVNFTSPFDETMDYDIHTVRYIPFIPSYGIIDLGYEIPVSNYIFFGCGIIFIIAGILIRQKKAEKKSPVPEEKKAFICPACKKEIDSDSIYCSHCGRKIIL